jgi:hypothetical protein
MKRDIRNHWCTSGVAWRLSQWIGAVALAYCLPNVTTLTWVHWRVWRALEGLRKRWCLADDHIDTRNGGRMRVALHELAQVLGCIDLAPRQSVSNEEHLLVGEALHDGGLGAVLFDILHE